MFSSARSFTAVALLCGAYGLSACGESGGAHPAAPRLDAGSDANASRYVDPSARGPYPVGNVTVVFTDDSRDEPITQDPTDKRTLVTEIWFPAAEDARTAPKDKFSGFFGANGDTLLPLVATALGLDPAKVSALKDLETGSVRDAKIADGGPFPLVLFSHGNGGLRFQSIFLTEYLASHGYVVVSPDHTGNAAIAQLPPPIGNVSYDAQTLTQPNVRVQDMQFLIDVMTRLNGSDPDGRLTSKVDVEHIAMTGHSYGGLTTLLVVAAEPRIDVGVPLAGPGVLASGVSIPMMHMLATEDQTIKAAGNTQVEQAYVASEGPRWILRLVDAGHFSFSDICLLNPDYGDGCGAGMRLEDQSSFTFLDHDRAHAIVNFYETALYGYYLKRISEYAGDLAKNPFDKDVVRDSDRVPGP